MKGLCAPDEGFVLDFGRGKAFRTALPVACSLIKFMIFFSFLLNVLLHTAGGSAAYSGLFLGRIVENRCGSPVVELDATVGPYPSIHGVFSLLST